MHKTRILVVIKGLQTCCSITLLPIRRGAADVLLDERKLRFIPFIPRC